MGDGDDPPPPAWMAALARDWLEDAAGALVLREEEEGGRRRSFNAVPLGGVRVDVAERGRALCSDADGKWHAGAIAAAADDIGAAAIMSAEGLIKVSVHCDVSYFAPAKPHEEVELDARVVGQKGPMTAVATEVRKKESGELVAVCRQWMTTVSPKGIRPSKL